MPKNPPYQRPDPSTSSQTREDALRDAIAARAFQAGRLAGTATSVARGAVVETFRAAVSLGERAVLYGSVLGMVAFLMPWFGASGSDMASVSGFEMARESAFLWFLPGSLAASSLQSFMNIKAKPHRRVLVARWFVLLGSFWTSLALVATLAGRALFGIAALGLYLTLLAVTMVMIGGMLQIRENLDKQAGEQA